MSGVFGVVSKEPGSEIRALSAAMAKVMSHRPFYVAEHFSDDSGCAGLGRMGIGIFNKSPQPVWNEDHSIALLMAGEIYNAEALGRKDPAESDEEFVLGLYQRLGDGFASRVNGAFIVAIWEKERRRLLIANDRFGLYPLYYTHHAGRMVFAPEVKAVLCDKEFARNLDWTALAQYMRFQHLLGSRTFFEGVYCLPPGSVLTFDGYSGALNIECYWDFSRIPYRADVTLAEAVEEVTRLLKRAVRRLSGDGYRPGVFLSGGLDSRLVLGLIKRRRPVSITFGRKKSRDVYYAARIARAVSSDHHWFDLPDGRWVLDNVDFHLELTEGFHSWIHMHGISTLPAVRQLMDVNLTGWDGGTIMGHSILIEPLCTSAVDDAAFLARQFYLFVQKWTWPSITEAEEQALFSGTAFRRIDGLAFDSFRSEIEPYMNLRHDVRAELFYIRNHCRRMTMNMVTVGRSHVEFRFPFFDYDLFEFLYSLPSAVRADRQVQRAVIQREAPRLAYIPYERDELLPTTVPGLREAHALQVRARRVVNKYLFPLFPERHTLYADYEGYLRDDLRSWAESILFDPRVSERGIFNPSFLQSLMKRHLSALEEWTIGKIASIISYELMLRRLYD